MATKPTRDPKRARKMVDWFYRRGVYLVLFLGAPLFVLERLVTVRRGQKWLHAIDAHRVDALWVDGADLVVQRGNGFERIALSSLLRGTRTMVDYLGEFAAANEVGVIYTFPRASGDGVPLVLALAHYDSRVVRRLEPLIERGILDPKYNEVRAPGGLGPAHVASMLLWCLALAFALTVRLGVGRRF